MRARVIWSTLLAGKMQENHRRGNAPICIAGQSPITQSETCNLLLPNERAVSPIFLSTPFAFHSAPSDTVDRFPNRVGNAGQVESMWAPVDVPSTSYRIQTFEGFGSLSFCVSLIFVTLSLMHNKGSLEIPCSAPYTSFITNMSQEYGGHVEGWFLLEPPNILHINFDLPRLKLLD
jgi:hypothetical protein